MKVIVTYLGNLAMISEILIISGLIEIFILKNTDMGAFFAIGGIALAAMRLLNPASDEQQGTRQRIGTMDDDGD